MDVGHRDLQYLEMAALQERPITLGELLFREENREAMEAARPRQMSRTMSPTRCLGPLANGRPRRARGRILARPSTSAGQSGPTEDNLNESQRPRSSQQRRRRASSGPFPIPTVSRWGTAEARIRNFHYLMNGSRASRRRGTSSVPRLRHRSLAWRSESPDLFLNPFQWHRRHSTGSRHARSRSATYPGPRQTLHGRSLRIRSSMARATPGGSRMIDVYETREARRASYRYLRSGRPRSRRPGTEANPIAQNGNSQSTVSVPMRRFIDFVAEFIPVREPSPDAEPPEWSLNVTAADFGPFAVGRSALSRARSLAIVGILSQANVDAIEAEQNANAN